MSNLSEVRPHPDPRNAEVPRPEYPRPSFVRDDWLTLNGTWQFAFDPGDSGLERGLVHSELPERITVPFCPESELSGIGETDFHQAVWYRRTVRIPESWRGRRPVLHFGAVDHDATVWVNGREVARHSGGFTSFSADLGGVVGAGDEAVVVVRARDSRQGPQARGKQSDQYANYSCHYTRTTGIWQSVWLEPVADTHLGRPRITPDLAAALFPPRTPLSGSRAGHRIRARLTDEQGTVVEASVAAHLDLAPRLVLSLPEERRRTWSPEDPHLYEIQLDVVSDSGTVVDSARCTAGLRSVTIEGKRVLLNGKPVFQRLVLDQGWYPDGLMTAPDDAALVRDIELSLAAGFNGARLHQKVFEERFLHHADRLGYLVWGEFGDWGASSGPLSGDNQQQTALLRRPVAGGGRAGLLAPLDHRLVPAQRDASAAPRPAHHAGRRDPCDVPRHQGRRHLTSGARRLRLLPPRRRDGRLRLALLRAGPRSLPGTDGGARQERAVHQSAG